MATLHLNDSNFNSEVIDSKQAVLVDFWADWCVPCKMIAPAVEEIAKENKGKLKVAKVNVDEGRSTATNFGIMSIPTLLLFKEGKIANQIVGVVSKGEIKSMIDEHLQS